MSDQIRAQVRYCQDPVRNLVNVGWIRAIEHDVRAAGSQVLLGAELGNHTLNSGGLATLRALRQRYGWRRWFSEASANLGRRDVRWTGILYNSFGGDLPRPARAILRNRFLSQAASTTDTFLLPEHAADRSVLEPDGWWDRRDSDAQRRWNNLKTVDFGTARKGGLAESGVETRDPMADRRIVEFSLGLPPERLLHNGIDRPLARAALADRVPPRILDNPLRGMQAADWPLMIDVGGLRDLAEEISASDKVRSLIDVPGLHRALDQWSLNQGHEFKDYERFACFLPSALAVGLFIREVERGTLGQG